MPPRKMTCLLRLVSRGMRRTWVTRIPAQSVGGRTFMFTSALLGKAGRLGVTLTDARWHATYPIRIMWCVRFQLQLTQQTSFVVLPLTMVGLVATDPPSMQATSSLQRCMYVQL